MIMRVSLIAAWTLSLALSVLAREESRLVFDRPELAGISGFRRYWDRPVVLSGDGVVEVVDHGKFGRGPSAVWAPEKRAAGQPGALVVDALHRRALVRFPDFAAAVHAHMAKGWRIQRVELLLPYRDAEFWPFDYAMPSGMSFLGDAWVRVPPRWHVVAWPLRRPWTADPEIGPTYNAWIAGSAHWQRFGAQDKESDRFPVRFGPVEVSYREATAYRQVEPETVKPPSVPSVNIASSRDVPDALGIGIDDLLAEMVAEEAPGMVINGVALAPEALRQVRIDQRMAWLAPLTSTPPDPAAVARRYRESRILLSTGIPAREDALIQDWYLVGPFPNVDA